MLDYLIRSAILFIIIYSLFVLHVHILKMCDDIWCESALAFDSVVWIICLLIGHTGSADIRVAHVTDAVYVDIRLVSYDSVPFVWSCWFGSLTR